MMNLDYLAGLIDGEGTLSFMSSPRHKRTSIVHRPYLSISNTSRELLLQVVESLDCGSIICHGARDPKKHRTAYSFRLNGPRLYPVLHSLRDRLHLKRPQCEALLVWIEKRSIDKTRGYTEADHALVERVKLMNSRGVR